jgi:hypothetical protein
MLFGEIHATNRHITPIIALLIVSSAEEFLSLDLSSSFDEECMVRLWDIYAAFKSHQPSMLAFLHDMMLLHSEFRWNYEPVTLAILLHAIEGSMSLPTDGDESVYHLLRLSNALPQLASYGGKHLSYRKQHVALTLHTERIRNIVLSKLSTMLVLGQSNLRLLACARISGEGLLSRQCAFHNGMTGCFLFS